MSQEFLFEPDTEIKIFLHHIDCFESNAIKNGLIEENIGTQYSKYAIFGTVAQPQNVVKVMHELQPVEILNSKRSNYIQRIIKSDIIIFNANSSNFEEVCSDMRNVINALENWTNEQKNIPESPDNKPSKKYLILISTPMVWALTTPIASDEDDEMGDYLLEDDYRRRSAHKSYCKHKFLERDVIWLQKRCKNFVKTLVVCPGVIYGAKNSKLHYIFKLAFYNKQVPIVRPGSQLIPMIYIKDFVQIMKNIFVNFPESKIRYIFAVQPTLMSLKSFTYHISRSFIGDCSKIRYMRPVELLKMDNVLFPQTVLDVLSLNIKMTPTYLKDFEFHEITDEFWDVLAQEFRDARNLHPLQIVVDGPPLVGKTEHAQKLSEYYQLFYIDISKVMNDYIKYLEKKISDSTIVVETFECPYDEEREEGEAEYEGEIDTEEERDENKKLELKGEEETSPFDEEDQNLVDDLKNRIEMWSKELFDLKVYVASHKEFKDQDFKEVSRCIIALLSTKQYNENQGYVIDNFPFTYDQANQIFFNTRTENGNIAPLKPTHVIIFDASDDVLCKRAMSLTETEAVARRCLRHQMLPRLDEYRERNEESNCLANLFYDNELIPISILVEPETQAVDTLRFIKTEIGSPFIYPLSIAQQDAIDKSIAAKRLKEEEQLRQKKEELAKSLNLERERKILNWTAKYEQLKKHRNELNEVKTLPLRQYLGKYVFPMLTEGILKVAELKPDDPVDFLAEYLFKYNPEGQQMPPFCTDEQRSRFVNAFYDDLTSNSEYAINTEKFECPDKK